MDPLTHGFLGATIGQAAFGRRLGWRGVVAGATAAMLPDLDILMNATGPMGEWLYHRSITHALWLPPVLAALVVGAWRGVGSAGARSAAVAVLALTTAYLFYGLGLNGAAEAQARAELASEGVPAAEVRAYPTLLQLYLRRIVARDGDEVRVGWLSLWSPRTIEWRRFTAARDPLVTAARETDEGRLLEWFAMGQTAAALRGSTAGTVVEIDDLRYGFPSRPREGLWGIRARFDAGGHLEGRPERIDRPLPAPVRALVSQIFRETFRPRP